MYFMYVNRSSVPDTFNYYLCMLVANSEKNVEYGIVFYFVKDTWL